MQRIAAALLTVVMALAWRGEARAFGCQASGAFPIFPSSGTTCGTPLHVGDTFDILINATNTSSSVPPGTTVTAKLVNTCGFPGANHGAECTLPAECDSGTCDAALFGTLGCTNTACLTELPGVLTFVPVGANGCVTSAAGIAACVPSPMGVNRYEIRADAGGVPLAAGATSPLATIRVLVTAPIPPPVSPCGQFGSRVDSSGNSFVTTDAGCDATATGGAAGSVNLFLPEPACAASPQAGCRQPVAATASRITLVDHPSDKQDSLAWRWARGAATAKSEFGDPLGTNDYRLCVYDRVATIPVLRLDAGVPAGGMCGTHPCWQETKRGFRYANKAATPDGIVRLELRAGVAGAAAITVKGRGLNLGPPSLPLAQDPSFTVQLQNNDGECWDATYSAPALGNTSKRFSDISD